jgi:NAD+ diphosphatase
VPVGGLRLPSGAPAEDLRAVLDLCGEETRFIPVVHDAVIANLEPTLQSAPGLQGGGHNAQLLSWSKLEVRKYLDSARRTAAVASDLADPPFAFLSWLAGKRYIAIDVPCGAPAVINLPHGSRPMTLRRVLHLLDAPQASLAWQAKSKIEWHRNNRFCGSCGKATVMAGDRGLSRRCVNVHCVRGSTKLYNRIDPSVIVLVTRGRGTECLLGRKPSWPPGKYSALAGFCELGESLEDTVVREVKEESGVTVDPGSIEYHSSQPWPYPAASVLSAFYANALNSTISLNDDELESAQWFSRDWLRAELGKPTEVAKISIPGPSSIAHLLIRNWLAQTQTTRSEAARGC